MFCMTFGRFQFQIDVMDKERFNTTVVLSHVTPGPVYVLTSRAVLNVLYCVLLRFKITLPIVFIADFRVTYSSL